MYMLGDAYFQEKKYPAAIGTFGKIIDLYPKSEIAPDAMYKNGLAFYSLKYCGDARIYFQEPAPALPEDRVEEGRQRADQEDRQGPEEQGAVPVVAPPRRVHLPARATPASRAGEWGDACKVRGPWRPQGGEVIPPS